MLEFSTQQGHLLNLTKQKSELKEQLESSQKLYWKVEGAIEYLEGIGVTLPKLEENMQVSNPGYLEQ